MANNKFRRKIVFALFFLLIVAFAGLVYFAFTVPTANADEPPIGDQTVINDDFVGSSSGTIWQSLYVTPASGQPYWANAPEHMNLLKISASQSGMGDDFKEVKTLQNNIYVNLPVEASTWTFSCQETITVTDSQGNLVKTVVDAQAVNNHGQSLPANTNDWVAGASLSGQQIEAVLNLPPGEYYFTISLSNINLSITVDGQQQNLSAQPGTDENVLKWLIKIE